VRIRIPSDAVITKLAEIAVHAQAVLAPNQPSGEARVGLKTVMNDRRRAMETIFVLLADPEVRAYLAELKSLGALD